MAFSKWLCGVVAGGALALASGAAQADVTWYVHGVFNDGSKLSGSFTLNQYGFSNPGGVDFITDAFEYTTDNSSLWNDAFTYEASPGYFGDLVIAFKNDLNAPSSGPNPILVGLNGPSYECTGSYSCYLGDPEQDPAGTYRWLVSGEATTTLDGLQAAAAAPEPSAWALSIVGFGLTGYMLRRRRLQTATAR